MGGSVALEIQDWTVEWVPLGELRCNDKNPRHNDAAVEHVAASLEPFGWQQPLVARADGVVIAGNTRLKAARELKFEKVPVVRFAGSDLESTAFAVADNWTAEFAVFACSCLSDTLRHMIALE